MKSQVNPSNSKSRQTKIWLLVGAGLAMIVLIMALSSPDKPLQAEIKFLCYTNNSAGTRLAAFEVVNRSSFTIRCLPHHFAAVPPGGSGVLLPAYKGQGINLLSPNARETVLVAPPSTTNAWQVKLSYTKQQPIPVQFLHSVMNMFGVRIKGKVSVVEGPVVEPQ